jgi:hypothetical protein
MILKEMDRVRIIGTVLVIREFGYNEYKLEVKWLDDIAKKYFEALQELLFSELKKEKEEFELPIDTI